MNCGKCGSDQWAYTLDFPVKRNCEFTGTTKCLACGHTVIAKHIVPRLVEEESMEEWQLADQKEGRCPVSSGSA